MTSDTNPWWIALGASALTAVGLFAGAVLKTFSDLRGQKIEGDSQWREALLKDIEGLRDWCHKQQKQIDDYVVKVANAEKSAISDQTMRHDLKNSLHSEQLSHEVLKTSYAVLQEKYHALETELALLKKVN